MPRVGAGAKRGVQPEVIVRASRGPVWTEARVRQEFIEFLGDAQEWPSYREFRNAGRGALRAAVTRCGGAPLWAQRLNLAYPTRRPGRAPYWDEERIYAAREEFLRGHTVWPSRQTFEMSGCKPLGDAIRRHGGAARWAAAFELELPDLRSGSSLAWTEERIESELRRVIGQGTCWPSRWELLQATSGLASAVSRSGGVLYWCDRLGPTRPPREIRSGPRVWTDERIRAELRAFCGGRSTWPTQREFIANGRSRLYQSTSRRGGVARWATELGLTRARR